MEKQLAFLIIIIWGIFQNKGSTQCITCPVVPQPDSVVKIYTQLPFHKQKDSVWVAVYDDLLIYEGDIVVGKLPDIKTMSQSPETVYCDVCALWSNSTIPYIIGPGFSSQMLGQINFAIDYLNKSTNLCVVARTNQSNYIKLVPSNVCNSWVGMLGGEQIVNLDDVGDNSGCWYGSIAHEILHAAGIWHEQSREDRDNFVDIFWDNIDPMFQYNFDKHSSDGQDLGDYDYLSIMHYGAYAFSINGQPTIKRKNGATDLIGNRDYISGTDIEAVNLLYDVTCGICLDKKMKITPHSMIHNNIGHWEMDGALYFQDNTSFSTNANSRAEFDSGSFIDINPTTTNSAPFEASTGSVVEMAIDGCPNLVPVWYSFQSLNFPNRYIRHYNFVTQIDKIEDLYAGMPADADFKMVTGLDATCADCVSFESKNYPNYFLIVDGGSGSQVRIAANGSVSSFTKKATFRLHSGFASASGITLESWFSPGNFINHSNYIIYIGPYLNDRVYRENATFKLTTGL